jgi:hypothetical protein
MMVRRREQEAERRLQPDRKYVERFALRVRELFPACPTGGERVIDEHTCRNLSGRIGRSAAGKSLDEEAIRLAVIAHVRHAETRYDELLAAGEESREAREGVEEDVLQVLANSARRKARANDRWPDMPEGAQPIAIGAGSKLREIYYLSPCLLWGILCPRGFSAPPSRGKFLEYAQGPGVQS